MPASRGVGLKLMTALAVLWALGVAADVTAAHAQRGGGFGGGFGGRFGCAFGEFDHGGYFISPWWAGNPFYDGRVTFARIKYTGDFSCTQEGPGWSHDYPRAESNFVNILREITSISPFIRYRDIYGSTILGFHEPELLRYPVAYLSEPGGWTMNDVELRGFKRYIERGGFIIFDDMGGRYTDLQQLVYQWRRAFPNAEPVPLAPDHPIFNVFFRVDLTKIPGDYGPPQFLAIFQDNDPKKRMLAAINNNTDIGELIQHSDRGFQVVPSTEAYKLWVNYFIYALTH